MKLSKLVFPVGLRCKAICFAAGVSLFFSATSVSRAFALLGPFSDWMSDSNSCRLPGDIGGPMDINEEYRWNVPVATYGFDQTFVDYFGSNGVAAVESAIQILNDLPPASDITLTNFPLGERRFNLTAQAQHLFDLKSAALTLLVEHMGLAPAERNIFDVRRFDPILIYSDESSWPTDAIPNLIIERNFDPETLDPSHSVNEQLFTGYFTGFPLGDSYRWEIAERLIDPLEAYGTAISDERFAGFDFSGTYVDSPSPEWLGAFDAGLSRDDAGGLKYLLSTNNVNLETLLPDVHGAGTNAGSYVNLADRPGIEKITFTKHPFGTNAGQFGILTNQYVDSYFTNGAIRQQKLERVITQPDILFSAADFDTAYEAHGYRRSGTSNWWNSASVPGSTNSMGPGVIRPPVSITFEKRGAFFQTFDTWLNSENDYHWGSYDMTTNPPIAYPQGATAETPDTLQIHFRLLRASGPNGLERNFDWRVAVPFGTEAVLESSSDLVNWTQIQTSDTVINRGGAIYWDNWCAAAKMFFRVRAATND